MFWENERSLYGTRKGRLSHWGSANRAAGVLVFEGGPMYLTDQKISDDDLTHIIWAIERIGWVYVVAHAYDIIFPALLELTQRRAQDKLRDAIEDK